MEKDPIYQNNFPTYNTFRYIFRDIIKYSPEDQTFHYFPEKMGAFHWVILFYWPFRYFLAISTFAQKDLLIQKIDTLLKLISDTPQKQYEKYQNFLGNELRHSKKWCKNKKLFEKKYFKQLKK
jgi:hypothetical protein